MLADEQEAFHLTARLIVAADRAATAMDQTLNALDFARDNDVIDAVDAELDQPVDMAMAPGAIPVALTVTVTADSDQHARELLLNAIDFARDNDVIDARDVTFTDLERA